MGKGVHKYNSLAFVRPDLAREWHPTKNGDSTPEEVTVGSNTKVWWLCEKGHSFDCRVVARTKRGNGCRFCKRQEVCLETCLATVSPELAKYWHPTLNGTLTPYDVFPNTRKKVYWLCEYEHVTYSSILHRNNGVCCSECNKGSQTSFPEQVLYFYLSRAFPDALNRHKIHIDGEIVEADIFLPSINLAVEYDGYYHHHLVERDELKCRIFVEHGINLIRVRLNTLPEIHAYGALILKTVKREMDSLKSCIGMIFRYITNNFRINEDSSSQLANHQLVDIQRDELEIYSNMVMLKTEKSIAVTHSSLINEWDFELNGAVKPEHLTAGVATKVWWKCDKGHPSYKMAVNKRTNGSGCNVCAGKKVIPETSLISTHPELCKEWDFELNSEITPQEVSQGSDKSVWWICKNGHRYRAPISARTRKNPHGCSYCNGQAVNHENCLATLYPDLALEWDYEKNENLLPTNVRAQSNKKVHWKCPNGHSWTAVIHSRSGGTGCPYCQGLLPTMETCLATVKPDLAAEWYSERNGVLTPSNVMPKSGRKVWWKCSKGHCWDATIASRSSGTCCPFCSGRKACKDNCLATVEPELAKEWHSTKNGELSPRDVTRSSGKRVWWLCNKCGREWQAFVYARSHNGVCKCKK